MLVIEELYSRIYEIDIELEGEYEDGETCFAANLEVERERLETVICILEEEELDKVSKIYVTNIKWDAPKSTKLPKSVEIDLTIYNADLLEDINGSADNLCDYLSDTYEYCIYGFATDVE